jgi:hypothetical protein
MVVNKRINFHSAFFAIQLALCCFLGLDVEFSYAGQVKQSAWLQSFSSSTRAFDDPRFSSLIKAITPDTLRWEDFIRENLELPVPKEQHGKIVHEGRYYTASGFKSFSTPKRVYFWYDLQDEKGVFVAFINTLAPKPDIYILSNHYTINTLPSIFFAHLYSWMKLQDISIGKNIYYLASQPGNSQTPSGFKNSVSEAKGLAETVVVNGVKAEVTASSTLKSKIPDAYSVKNLFDNNPATAWVEGASGAGKGEWVKIEFEKEVSLDGIVFEPGYRKSYDTFRENAFPTKIAIYLDNSKTSFNSSFRYLQDPNIEPGLFPFSKYNSGLSYLAKLEGQKAKSVFLKITASVEGTKYKDMAISGITFITKGQSAFYQKLFEFDNTRDQEKIFWKNDRRYKDKCGPLTKYNPQSEYKYSEVKTYLNDPSFYHQIFNGSSTYTLIKIPCKNNSVLVLGDPKFRIDINSDKYDNYLYFKVNPVFVYRMDNGISQKGILFNEEASDGNADDEFPTLPYLTEIFE